MDPSIFETADFEQIQVLRDPRIGFWGFVAIHSTGAGPAFGGVRRWIYESPAEAILDALRLAEAMTLKCAIHRIPGGGGKAVILQRPELDRRAAYRLLGNYVQQMRGRFFTGPDAGTEAEDLRVMGEVCDYVALPDDDGPGNLAEPTALGVFAGIRAVAQRLGSPLSDLTIAVQGLGEVGSRLAAHLGEAGARLLVADVLPDRAFEVAMELDAQVVDSGAIRAVECDIYAPCAMGGVIHRESVPELRARAVAGSANNVLRTAADGEELHRRGILYAPDFVINSGALVHGALFHLDGKAPATERIERIGDLLGDILDRARDQGLPPEQLAERMAREQVSAAGSGHYMPGGAS